MERLLARLERTLGRFAIERLTTFLVAGMAALFAISFVQPALASKLVLVPQLVAREPWRLVTWLVLPPDTSFIFIFFALMFLHFVGTSLEATWGAFKFNVYYFVGALATIAAAFITGRPQTNYFLTESLFFALATIAPNFEITLLLIPVPIKLKWLGLVGVAFVAYQFLNADTAGRIGIGVAFANYALFFSGHLVSALAGRRVAVRQAARRASHAPPPARAAGRVCAICGARQDDGADIRVCSCDKCGGKARDLCLTHARNH